MLPELVGKESAPRSRLRLNSKVKVNREMCCASGKLHRNNVRARMFNQHTCDRDRAKIVLTRPSGPCAALGWKCKWSRRVRQTHMHTACGARLQKAKRKMQTKKGEEEKRCAHCSPVVDNKNFVRRRRPTANGISPADNDPPTGHISENRSPNITRAKSERKSWGENGARDMKIPELANIRRGKRQIKMMGNLCSLISFSFSLSRARPRRTGHGGGCETPAENVWTLRVCNAQDYSLLICPEISKWMRPMNNIQKIGIAAGASECSFARKKNFFASRFSWKQCSA